MCPLAVGDMQSCLRANRILERLPVLAPWRLAGYIWYRVWENTVKQESGSHSGDKNSWEPKAEVGERAPPTLPLSNRTPLSRFHTDGKFDTIEEYELGEEARGRRRESVGGVQEAGEAVGSNRSPLISSPTVHRSSLPLSLRLDSSLKATAKSPRFVEICQGQWHCAASHWPAQHCGEVLVLRRDYLPNYFVPIPPSRPTTNRVRQHVHRP